MLQRKVCLYVRVSTDNQQGGLESQIRALKEWCFRNQITEYELYTDEGISGAKESRPSLNRLMELVEQNRVEQVIVFSFSRFARSTSHLLKALKTFKERNTRFISITESIDTNSPLGIALYTILGALAQLEREMICERVRAGMKNAKAKGVRIGRVRKRNSVLIESLLDAGLSFRDIAKIAKCSHGSVSAQKKEWLKKKSEAEALKLAQLTNQVKENQIENTVEQMKALDISDDLVLKVQEKLEKEARENVRQIQGIEAYDTFD